MPPEYFTASVNRELFSAYRRAGDIAALRADLDEELEASLADILGRDYTTDGVAKGYADYRLKNRQTLRRESNLEERLAKVIIRLRENYLRREIEAAQAAVEAGEDATAAPLQQRLLELTGELLAVQTLIKMAGRGQSFYAGR